VANAFGELPVALAQMMRTLIVLFHLAALRIIQNTVRMAAVAFPLVGHEVDERLVTARRRTVTIIVLLATPVDGVDDITGAEESAIAAVAFVGERIAIGGAAHHAVQMENIPAAPLTRRRLLDPDRHRPVGHLQRVGYVRHPRLTFQTHHCRQGDGHEQRPPRRQRHFNSRTIRVLDQLKQRN